MIASDILYVQIFWIIAETYSELRHTSEKELSAIVAKIVNYFREMLHLRCLTGLWMHQKKKIKMDKRMMFLILLSKHLNAKGIKYLSILLYEPINCGVYYILNLLILAPSTCPFRLAFVDHWDGLALFYSSRISLLKKKHDSVSKVSAFASLLKQLPAFW